VKGVDAELGALVQEEVERRKEKWHTGFFSRPTPMEKGGPVDSFRGFQQGPKSHFGSGKIVIQ
jgi:hypothetical protein